MELEPEVVIFCLLFVFLECLEVPQLKTVKNMKLIKIGICEKQVHYDRIAWALNVLPFFILEVFMLEIFCLIAPFHGPVGVTVPA